ncbi:MAG: hypothetical protein WC979_07410 [Candidatus Pacearchaeota archaeon]|jgi:hypothetical protein
MITLEQHYKFEGKPVTRILLGNPIPVSQSNITIQGDRLNIPGTITGSVGFLDYLVTETLLPASRKSDFITTKKTIRVPFLGIEPAYQGVGLCSYTLQELEEIAKKQECAAITIEDVKNPFLVVWGNRHRYKPYWDYKNILKYLEEE